MHNWQVKYELDGYETKHSQWMPVPPEQLGVNVELVSNATPTVERVNGYPDGIEIAFSKYMKLGNLASNITVNGASGTIEPVDAEDNFDPDTNQYSPPVPTDERTQYASVVRFVPASGTLNGNVQVNISDAVQSYAGVNMATATRTVSIQPEPKNLTVGNMSLEYGKDDILNITADTAAAGKTLKAESDDPFIVSVTDNATIDASGKASIPITGNLPGRATITLRLEDTSLKAETDITVGEPESGKIQGDSDVITPPMPSDVKVLSVGDDDAFINLTTEILNLGEDFTPEQFSVIAKTGKNDKWVNYNKLDLNKLLSKGWVSLKFKNGDTEIEFPEVEKRGKTGNGLGNIKLGAWYPKDAPTYWVLADKSKFKTPDSVTAISDDLEYCAYGTNKKPTNEWKIVGKSGFEMTEMANNKVVKTPYAVRESAKAVPDVGNNVKYYPAAKTVKVSSSSYGKPTKLSFKTGKAPKLKLKAGTMYMVDGETIGLESGEVDFTVHAGKKVVFWMAATGKKPETTKQTAVTVPATST